MSVFSPPQLRRIAREAAKIVAALVVAVVVAAPRPRATIPDDSAVRWFSPDGATVVTFTHGKPVQVWDTRSGALIARHDLDLMIRTTQNKWGPDEICITDISPDGSRLYFHSRAFADDRPGRLVGFDWRTGKTWSIPHPNADLYFTPRFVVRCPKSRVDVIDPENGAVVRSFAGDWWYEWQTENHSSREKICLTRYTEEPVGGESKRETQIWDAARDRTGPVLEWIGAPSLNKDLSRIIGRRRGPDGVPRVELWDTDPDATGPLAVHPAPQPLYAFVFGTQSVCAVTDENVIEFFKLPTLARIASHSNKGFRVVSPSGDRLITGGPAGAGTEYWLTQYAMPSAKQVWSKSWPVAARPDFLSPFYDSEEKIVILRGNLCPALFLDAATGEALAPQTSATEAENLTPTVVPTPDGRFALRTEDRARDDWWDRFVRWFSGETEPRIHITATVYDTARAAPIRRVAGDFTGRPQLSDDGGALLMPHRDGLTFWDVPDRSLPGAGFLAGAALWLALTGLELARRQWRPVARPAASGGSPT